MLLNIIGVMYLYMSYIKFTSKQLIYYTLFINTQSFILYYKTPEFINLSIDVQI